MLVQMVDVFDGPSGHRAADREIVEHRQVLHGFAQSDSAGVRAYRYVMVSGEQQDRDVLGDSAHPAGVELKHIDRLRPQQLLEHHSVVDVLASGDPDRSHRLPDRRMAKDVVG